MFFSSPIHHTFAPLGNWKQCLQALALILQPWKYKRGSSIPDLERSLSQQFEAEAFAFGSGREALLALLQALKLRPGEEVIVQGYTCVVVPNAIHAAGGVPRFADIDPETLNMDPASVEALITPRTRAVICQHTFGIPANIPMLRSLCDRYGSVLIEDCAHVIPDESGPSEIGSEGDFLILSFVRDKAISGVSGGAVLSRDPEATLALKRIQGSAIDHASWTILLWLLYPLIYAVARPFYGILLGKIFLAVCRKIRLLVPILQEEEKEGSASPLLHRIPHACAHLALAQLRALKSINDHRRMLTNFYREERAKRGFPILDGIKADLPLQKFPIFLEGAERIRQKLKKHNIHLNDGWTGCVICPDSVELAKTDYQPGSDPEAEEACVRILSLPTHPKMHIKQAKRLLEAMQDRTLQ